MSTIDALGSPQLSVAQREVTRRSPLTAANGITRTLRCSARRDTAEPAALYGVHARVQLETGQVLVWAQLALDRNGKPKITLGKVTVAHERAPVCSTKAFGRTKFEKPPAPLHALF